MDIKDFDRRLQQHDWHFSYSDDAAVYRRGEADRKELERLAQTSPQHDLLFRAYVTYNQSMPHGDKHADYALALKMARIASGAITQAELDAIAEEKRLRDQREAERKWQELVKFDQLCSQHHWFYWRHDLDSEEYQQGALERRRLLEKAPAYLSLRTANGVYVKLFRTWAAFKSAEDAHHNRAYGSDARPLEEYYAALYDELSALRHELGL